MDEIIVSQGGKKVRIPVKRVGVFGSFRGLMFRPKNTENLLFEGFSGSIHSWFVFFPFLALWLDSSNKVIDYKLVRPFRIDIRPKKPYNKLVEIPLNDNNSKFVRLLVGEERFK